MKILFYTHNSVGVGHVNRVLAVIKGMQKVSSTIEFLVVSGTSVPQLFLENGIEIVKLPSTKIVFKSIKDQWLEPRYLNMPIGDVLSCREKLIRDTFDFFKPTVVIVEHNMVGQGWELAPILFDKWRNPKKFKLVFVTRGIIDSPKEMRLNYNRKQHLVESINVQDLFDNIFVLDSKNNIDYSKDYGFDKSFCNKTEYLGLITTKNKNEFDENATRKRLGIGNKKLILVTLGRIGKIEYLVKLITKEFLKLPIEYVLKIQIDPYLDKTIANKIRKLSKNERIFIPNFSPNLIEEINLAELVISRGGYNIVSEILLTGTKSILFPEVGRTEEELYRCEKISQYKHIKWFDESKLEPEEFGKTFQKLIENKQKKFKTNIVFDNKTIAKKMLKSIGEN